MKRFASGRWKQSPVPQEASSSSCCGLSASTEYSVPYQRSVRLVLPANFFEITWAFMRRGVRCANSSWTACGANSVRK
jgi:hypothetical protein